MKSRAQVTGNDDLCTRNESDTVLKAVQAIRRLARVLFKLLKDAYSDVSGHLEVRFWQAKSVQSSNSQPGREASSSTRCEIADVTGSR